jgi:hypothetical protein
LFHLEASANDEKVILEDAAEKRSSGAEDIVPDAEFLEEGDTQAEDTQADDAQVKNIRVGDNNEGDEV